ncbi:MAG: AbgT family transporter, partial [Synergistaceae bacterium]|nr:AbgT family transporter [Synergistaceae bacterium]
MQKPKKRSKIEGFIKAVERGGNKLPHPVTLFTILAALILVLSFIFAKMGTSVTYMTVTAEGAKETTVTVVNLLSKAQL